MPKKIANAPELEEHNQIYYDAFTDLDTCRNYEMGPIPYLTIVEYCLTHDLEYEMLDKLAFVIRKLDWYLIDKAHKKANKKG